LRSSGAVSSAILQSVLVRLRKRVRRERAQCCPLRSSSADRSPIEAR
jgi:hypothetical protein